jgi:hypothetical protein
MDIYRDKVVGVFVRFRAPLHPDCIWQNFTQMKYHLVDYL